MMTDRTHALIRTWRKLPLETAPYLLPDDESLLREWTTADPKGDYCTITSWNDVVADLAEHREPDHRLHTGLLPQPYIGNLATARAVILLLNPGHDPSDYHAELRCPEVRDRFERTLRQQFEGEEYPFQFLDPSLAWHGGFRWWHRKLRALIEALSGKWGCDYARARKHVSSRIAALQLVPYHSRDFGLAEKRVLELQSSRLALDYVSSELVPRAQRGEVAVVAMRKARLWFDEVTATSTHLVKYDATAARGAHLSEGSSGWNAIFPMLLADPPTDG